jgi:NADH dehydrogenase [ubiquinone] 1 alpha subcomplex assembly factor 5
MALFSLQTYQLHQKRAQDTFPNHRFLFDHVGDDLLDRLQNMKGDFTEILDLSPFSVCHTLSCHSRAGGDPESYLTRNNSLHTAITVSTVENMLDPHLCGNDIEGGRKNIPGPFSRRYSLPSNTLPFPDHSFDLVLSCLLAHWVDNIPQFLKDIHRCLRPGGLFLGAVWGGNTLHELRESLLAAELKLKGGASPRVAPMLQPQDTPLLLGQAGFSMPVVDMETLSIEYPSLLTLMKDLRGMGEANKIQDRIKTFSGRSLFEKAEEIYRASFSNQGTKIIATFEPIYLTGWKK